MVDEVSEYEGYSMKYFLPIVAVAADLESRFAPLERLGGQPWGLTGVMWPQCSHHQKPQSLLAQLAHHPERLDLGGEGRMLFVFQCNHEPGLCASWRAGSGCNARFVLLPSELSGTPYDVPPDAPAPHDRAVVITGWEEHDDDIPSKLAPKFLKSAAFYALPEPLLSKITDGTRLGGAPFWIQSPDEALKHAFRFVGQLGSSYRFLKPPNSPSPDNYKRWGPNFGGDGIGYIFLREGPERPQGVFFWQCS
jgi:hypothetical protein